LSDTREQTGKMSRYYCLKRMEVVNQQKALDNCLMKGCPHLKVNVKMKRRRNKYVRQN
jgi:hypothetical protein